MKPYWMKFYSSKLALIGLLLTSFMLPSALEAQDREEEKKNFYWLAFKDKPAGDYELDRPEEFLSQRAIQRRKRFNIEVTEADLPINEAYVKEVIGAGVQLWLRSRWMNGVVVLAQKGQLKKLEKLDFVKEVIYTGPYNIKPRKPRTYEYETPNLVESVDKGEFYGAAQWNVEDLGVDKLHEVGFDGRGMLVAVLDGGFPAVDVHPYINSPYRNGEILAYDLVEQDGRPYDGSSHGTAVLSSMAAYAPGVLVGTAPQADYLCIKTESGYGEHRQEEFNWLVGIELADSLGADVANSSLGYTFFDEKSMNYKYEDLTGEVSPASIAASLAADRGMLIVLSAGNEGNDPWHYVSAPADAKNVLAIGAVDSLGQKASFSSYGPTADGRTKPEVSAPGVAIPCVQPSSLRLRYANGTSLASPLVAGLAASLWQAFPNMSNSQIMDAIQKSSHQANNPDNSVGSGIPDAWKAYKYLRSLQLANPKP